MSKHRYLRTAATALAATGLVLAAPHPAGASVGGGNVAISWSIPGTPAAGLTTLTFPLTVNPATAHQDGIYFAQQFSFQHDVAGYTGLQPRPNSGGHERLHGVFSVFGDGTTTSDPNCSAGADGGSGVSCAVEFDGVYGHQYALKVARTGTDTWSGTATDTVTGTSVHIGTYTVPSGSGNLQGSQGGFVEYYLGIPSCAAMPRSDAVFGGPTSSDAGGLSGTSTADYEYSDCVGQSGYQAQQVGSGTHVTRGFVSAAAPLANGASGRCLDDADSSTTDGGPVILYDCHGGANQQWAQPGGNELTVNGMCLDATAGGTSPGTKAEIWDCHGGTNQQWTFAADGTVRGVQSGLCLGPVGNATGNGTGIELQTCDGRAGQVWSRG